MSTPGQPSTSTELTILTHRSASALPKINLPTFDGMMNKWESFQDRFISMIVNDKTLSNVMRMHYLTSCFTGDASKVVDHLAITDANFEVAWELIMSRYDNKRRLIIAHLQNLCHLPQVNNETSKELQNLLDLAHSSIQRLKNLNRPIDQWDDVLVYIIVQKLDKASRRAWELDLGDTVEYPTFAQLETFLKARIRALESLVTTSSKVEHNDRNSNRFNKPKSLPTHNTTILNFDCPLCKSRHYLNQCTEFLIRSPKERFDFIEGCKRCINCFSPKHSVKICTNRRSCVTCKKQHHSLLHITPEPKPSRGKPIVSTSNVHDSTHQVSEINSLSLTETPMKTPVILLATARVRVYSPRGGFVNARALLDQGSVATLITENLSQRLCLSRKKVSASISGVGDVQASVRYAADITVTPNLNSTPEYSTTALILKTLTKYTPIRVTGIERWSHISDLKLADDNPISSDPIDIIIGADLYGSLILEGLRKGAADQPVAQNTVLAWILSGPYNSSTQFNNRIQIHHGTLCTDLSRDIHRFWEIENVPSTQFLTPDEQQCEGHFIETHSRNPDGRYVVRYPFKSGPPIDIGQSRDRTLNTFFKSERRLQRNPDRQAEYCQFLREYETLGHMAQVVTNPVSVTNNLTNSENCDFVNQSSQTVYIPHHEVLREDSLTSRIRVVFNASSVTSNRTSLNDHLLSGPKLQTDLASVILRWRQYRYVYVADIEKMYRQILIDPRDRDYQRIFSRLNPSDPIREYQSLTVTYGTKSAPYQALRGLQQLRQDEGAHFPLALPILSHEIYVDDCIFGADHLTIIKQTRDQLILLFRKVGLDYANGPQTIHRYSMALILQTMD